MEIETNDRMVYSIGKKRDKDNDCEFEVAEGFKIIAFAGVMEVMLNDCRLLNLSITSKEILDECANAE